MPLWQDIRYGLRVLARAPLFTSMALLTLALGIGANTAIFSIVEAVLLERLPYGDADRLVMVWETSRSTDDDQVPVAPADYFDWQAAARQLEIAGFHPWSFNLTGSGDPERVQGGVATAGLFELMGQKPVLGRLFRPDEDRPDGPPVVLLGHDFWHRRFGGDPGVVGRTLVLDDLPFTVVGILPAGFDFPDKAEIWKPFGRSPEGADREFQFVRVLGRLRPGATLAAARAEMTAVAARLAREYPQTNADRGANLVPLPEQLFGEVRPKLLVLAAAVALMLVAACFNVANLLLVRALGRREETAVRQAVGASRGRLVRQHLTESLLLAGFGGLAGLLVARLGVWFFVTFGPKDVPRLEHASLDGAAVAFALAVTLVAGGVFGLAPALEGARPARRLRGRQGLGRLLGVLASVQVAIALMLLVAAGLLGRSFVRLTGIDPGFDPADVLTLQLSLPATTYSEQHQTVDFARRLLAEVRALPGVAAAGTTIALPIGGGMNIDQVFTIEGQPPPPPDQAMTAMVRAVSPGYFEALRIPVVSGRAFTDNDDAGATQVVVVNETLARRYWPGGDPLGQRLEIGLELGRVGRLETAARQVVGVVRDLKHAGLDADTAPEIYLPTAQGTWRFMALAVRAERSPEALTRPVQEAIWRQDPKLPATRIRTMAEVVGESVGQPRFYALLVVVFAGAALVLAAVGVYGVISYSVSQRKQEIGIRMALGARRRDVLRMVVSEGMALTALGIVVGVPLSLGLNRFLTSLLFGVEAGDAATLVAVCLALAGVALLSSYLPARRATRTDPMATLRLE